MAPEHSERQQSSMTQLLDDSEIERLRASGDEELGVVFEEHADRLDRIIDLRLDPRLAGRVDPADVVQETFLEAHKKLPRYLENATVPVFVWLRGVALDTLIHVHRRHLAQMRDAGLEVSIHGHGDTVGVSSQSLAGWLVGDLTSPSQAVIREEVVAKVAEALESMDEIDREVLVLRHFEQLSNDEVAAIVGVKKAATSRRYTRALIRFKETVEGLPGFDW
jgi:RNA polymerase sigma-70 factor, ECF subfamily